MASIGSQDQPTQLTMYDWQSVCHTVATPTVLLCHYNDNDPPQSGGIVRVGIDRIYNAVKVNDKDKDHPLRAVLSRRKEGTEWEGSSIAHTCVLIW